MPAVRSELAGAGGAVTPSHRRKRRISWAWISLQGLQYAASCSHDGLQAMAVPAVCSGVEMTTVLPFFPSLSPRTCWHCFQPLPQQACLLLASGRSPLTKQPGCLSGHRPAPWWGRVESRGR